MDCNPYTEEAFWLLNAGNLALIKASARGLPIDVEYARATRKRLREEMCQLEETAWSTPGGDAWVRKYGKSSTLGNPTQVRTVLFDVLGLPQPHPSDVDGSEAGTADKDALMDVDHPLAELILQWRRREKAANTFLSQLIREASDGAVHPWFHLHRVLTYRSSSSAPNFQNFPARDKEMAKLIRDCFRAPPGWCWIESDYTGIEVRVAACYHLDPEMLRNVEDKTRDMHRDAACECYCLSEEEYRRCLPKPKDVRHAGKNSFVFPEFYGSWWPEVAPSLWKAMLQRHFALDIQAAEPLPMAAHLASKGVTECGRVVRDRQGRVQPPAAGTFLAHIKAVEDRFWKERFPVYAQWKRDWYAQYQKRGYFDSKTGFRESGIFRKNDVCNHPIQGDAFHCLLRSFIRMDEELPSSKLRGRPRGQIHDAIVSLVPEGEVQDYLALSNRIMVTELKESWPWLVTPIEVEHSVSPAGGTWYEKEEV